MTLGEFLHPLNKASQRDLVLAVMYYLKRYEDKGEVTTKDIAAAFAKAKHTKGKKIQLAAVLNQAVPYVHSPGKDKALLLWAITDTGEKRVRQLMDLPAAEPEVEADVSTLLSLSAKIPDVNVRDYVDEGIKCLQVGALRAATVFVWTGAIASLRERLWSHGPATIDAALKVHNPKARSFAKKDDFSYIKDVELHQGC